MGSLAQSTGSLPSLPPAGTVAFSMLLQSSSPQFPSPADGSLIASFQPVPPETLALLPGWRFARFALMQKAAAGVRAGLVAPSEEGAASSPAQPAPDARRPGGGWLPAAAADGSCRLPCAATFFLHKDNL